MKKLTTVLLLLLSVSIYASEPLKIGVITDTHYLAKSLMDNGYAIDSYVQGSGKNVKAVPEILDKVILDLENENLDILLIPGDLTKEGEKQSHIEYSNRLKGLHQKGVKIFVIPGNHDVNMPNSLKYQGNKTYKVENISASEFAEIYKDYGYAGALERDENSLSYAGKLNETTWLLAIDAGKYEDNKERPITSGRVKAETKEWMKTILERAKAENKQVIAMMHWGLVEHLPMQASMFKDYLVDDREQIANLLADNGVKLVFTGHFHSNDVSMYKSPKGNPIYDIETGSLVFYPFSYRIMNLDKVGIDIKTRKITSTPSFPNLAEDSKNVLKGIAMRRAKPMLEQQGFQFSEVQMKQIAKIAGELFVLHLAGDEVVKDETKDELIAIFKKMGLPVDESLTNFELDLPPADNNLRIDF